MRLPPPVNLPQGGTPAERLDIALRRVLSVPKETILKAEAEDRKRREKKRAAKKPN